MRKIVNLTVALVSFGMGWAVSVMFQNPPQWVVIAVFFVCAIIWITCFIYQWRDDDDHFALEREKREIELHNASMKEIQAQKRKRTSGGFARIAREIGKGEY